ncbi:hypothetical protein MBLNU459_g4735t1 [Dothideomycetes sp. NU459]
MSVPDFALPGDGLAPASSHTPGSGAHIYASNVYASIAGPVSVSSATKKTLPSITVSAQTPSSSTAPGAALPSVGDVVLGRVTRTNPRQATLDLLALGATGATVLREPFQALIRQQDIRATEIDKVRMGESFRVGDIVRGVVISLGDERNYYVSTARNEYGVVLATSEAGVQMMPVSWREMREVEGQGAELRKVAKPV